MRLVLNFKRFKKFGSKTLVVNDVWCMLILYAEYKLFYPYKCYMNIKIHRCVYKAICNAMDLNYMFIETIFFNFNNLTAKLSYGIFRAFCILLICFRLSRVALH